MTHFAMTFNRPAVLAFFGEAADAVRIKIIGRDHILIKPVPAETRGKDVFQLVPRTRGGAGIVVEGAMAQKLVQQAAVERGSHIRLEPGSRNWINGETVDQKPSKVIPTARLWSVKELA